MNCISQEFLKAHNVYVPADNPFQQRARLLQALWREEKKYACGEHRGAPLGSRLTADDAKSLHNFLSPNIRSVVNEEVYNKEKSKGKLYGRPRIFNDLLSSQPLCFNLFGELKHDRDLSLASRVFRRIWPDRVKDVHCVEFEESPGRNDKNFSDDQSAFDVFIRHSMPNGGDGFIGIEVKYHEDLKNKASWRSKEADRCKQERCYDELQKK